MTNKKSQTQKALTSTLIVSGLMIFAFIGILATKDPHVTGSGLLVGLPIFIASFISIFGLIQTIKAFKETKTTKLFISLIVNSLVIILFITLIVANVLDVVSAVTT